VGAVAALGILDHAPAPYVGIGLLASILCFYSFRRVRSTTAKLLWLNLGIVMAFLCLYELRLVLGQGPTVRYDKSRGYEAETYFVDDADLGYAAKPSVRIQVSRLVGDRTIYDLTHTIDETGLRISPPVRTSPAPLGCLWFFGGSYTFGEGVEDDKTMPYRVGMKTKGAYVVRNFGFHGYGPHQMLAELQSGRSEDRAGCRPTHVIYQALVWHAMRSNGRSSWDTNGPYYVLDHQGRPRRLGSFLDQDLGRPPAWILRRLERSQIYLRHFAKYVDPYQFPLGRDDMRLMIAIVVESADEIARRFPGAEFHVLIWNFDEPPYLQMLVEGLAGRGITVELVSDAIPDYRTVPESTYRLDPLYDRHPTALAHDRIADYVVREILHQKVE